MRNIQFVLKCWGSWASPDPVNCKWPRSSLLAKLSIAKKKKITMFGCGDDDGIKIDAAIRKLKDYKRDYYSLIIMYYLKHLSTQKIADSLGISRNQTVKLLQAAEGFIEGCLVMDNVKLEIDKFARDEKKYPPIKNPIQSHKKSILSY
ncbi:MULTISPECIES: antiterminator Q family protein [Arsenophonus]|uniref:antiterminator Q family protein n=1 Tax=Arsenophonus TaxID=637 RepID=UPI003879B9A8